LSIIQIVVQIPSLKGTPQSRQRRSDKQEFRETIVYAHQASTTKMFDVLVNHWLSYWVGKGSPWSEPAARIYANWCAPGQARRGWYAGVTPGIPVNNCGLEASNGTLKVDADENAPFADSMETIKLWLENHSAVRDPGYVNAITFNDLPMPSQTMWVDALQLKCSFGKTIELMEVEVEFMAEPQKFYIVAPIGMNNKKRGALFAGDPTDEEKQTRAEILVLKLVHSTWADLPEVVSFFRDFNIVGPWPHDLDIAFTKGLVKGRRHCHCADFTREFVCKHELAVRLYLKEVVMPAGIAQFKHSGKRRRGAPKKALGNGRYGSSLFDPVASDEEADEDENGIEEDDHGGEDQDLDGVGGGEEDHEI
jgi:hypothetical protein